MTDLIIDPQTGEPKAGSDDDKAAKKIEVSEEDWTKLNTRLDVFEKMFSPQGAQPSSTPTPTQPKGPSLADQVSEIDKKIEAIDEKIDEAIVNQQPISKLNRERDTLRSKRDRLQIQHEDIDPLRNIGLSTMSRLSGELNKGKMKHVEIIQGDFDNFMAQLPPDQRVTSEAFDLAYNYAVGKNADKIIEAEREKTLRSAADQAAQDATNSSRYTDKSGNEIPKPEDVLSSSAFAALREKGQTVDDYYRTLGYEGWGDYYEKNKEYIY